MNFPINANFLYICKFLLILAETVKFILYLTFNLLGEGGGG